MRKLFRRLAYLARHNRFEDDFAEELAFHLEARQGELERGGMSPDEARAAARRAMGNVALAHDDARAVWIWSWLEQAGQDVRYGFRTLARSPGFTFIAVVTLGLGIGANAAIFSLLNAIFLKPLPVDAPDRLVGVFQSYELPTSYGDYTYYRDHNRVFSGLAAVAPVYLADGDDARELDGYMVSGNYFNVVGVKPVAGRTFLPSEDTVPGRDPVAVLGYAFWQSRFNGDVAIVGRPIRLNGVVFTIIGVLPEAFRAPQYGQTPVEVWIPSMMADLVRPGTQDSFRMFGRLLPAETLESARAELSVLAAQLDRSSPLTDKHRELRFWMATGAPPGEFADHWGRLPRMLMAGVSCLLLIACTNLAGLLLARGLSRQREIAVRMAIGAGGGRILRQVLTESVLLSVLAALPAILIARALGGLLGGYYGTEIEGNTPYFDFSIDRRVLAYTFGVAIVTGLVFGMLPAFQARRTDFISGLKIGTGAARRRSRARTALLVGQVALCVALLINAGLLTRSLATVLWPDFQADRVAFIRMKPHLVGYNAQESNQYFGNVARKLETLPGVEVVGFAGYPPVADWCCEGAFSRRVQAPGESSDAVIAMRNGVSPRFFDALGIRLVAGRYFDERDVDNKRQVVVVNEAFAQRLWPGGNALGQLTVFQNREYEIVGIVRYRNYQRGDGQRHFFVFFPGSGNRMFVRVAADPRAMLPMLRAAITETDPAVPISEELALGDMIENIFMPVQLGSVILSYASLLALLLSALGVYGVLAFSVRQRTREIGIRLALGAERSRIMARVLSDGILVVSAGSVLGLVAALMTSRLVTAFLYGVQARDWAAFIGGPLVLLLVGLVASYLPARRAASVSPMEAARAE